MGAAQFDGRPGDVLEARLTEAKRVYDLGLAPLIIGVAETIDEHEPDLTLIGLRLIHERNI
mgnify:CR=1 FL=1